MKFLLLVFFSLLATVFYFISHNNFSISSPSVTLLTIRRSVKEQMLPLHHGNEYEKNKVLDEDEGKMAFPESFREEEHLSSNDLELVYHIDYNGVTTHPIPTPKHPRP